MNNQEFNYSAGYKIFNTLIIPKDYSSYFKAFKKKVYGALSVLKKVKELKAKVIVMNKSAQYLGYIFYYINMNLL